MLDATTNTWRFVMSSLIQDTVSRALTQAQNITQAYAPKVLSRVPTYVREKLSTYFGAAPVASLLGMNQYGLMWSFQVASGVTLFQLDPAKLTPANDKSKLELLFSLHAVSGVWNAVQFVFSPNLDNAARFVVDGASIVQCTSLLDKMGYFRPE